MRGWRNVRDGRWPTSMRPHAQEGTYLGLLQWPLVPTTHGLDLLDWVEFVEAPRDEKGRVEVEEQRTLEHLVNTSSHGQVVYLRCRLSLRHWLVFHYLSVLSICA